MKRERTGKGRRREKKTGKKEDKVILLKGFILSQAMRIISTYITSDSVFQLVNSIKSGTVYHIEIYSIIHIFSFSKFICFVFITE